MTQLGEMQYNLEVILSMIPIDQCLNKITCNLTMILEYYLICQSYGYYHDNEAQNFTSENKYKFAAMLICV